jgi:hypothetical protein
VGCREEFLSKEASVVLWLFVLKEERILRKEGFLGVSE